ncbi:MAG: ribosome assembly RNA-binding protein YhbY [Desulfopila sp.]
MSEDHPSTTPTLTSRQKKYLKGLAHDLHPLVLVGKEGLSPAVIETTNQELLHRELIKVKLGKNSGMDKNDAGIALSAATGSSLVQLIGKTLVLYRANPKRDKKERIRLPHS